MIINGMPLWAWIIFYALVLIMLVADLKMFGRKGEDEIDLIALNEFDKTGIVAEVKRQSHRISLKNLEEKMMALPSSDFGKYSLSMCGLSMEDM